MVNDRIRDFADHVVKFEQARDEFMERYLGQWQAQGDVPAWVNRSVSAHQRNLERRQAEHDHYRHLQATYGALFDQLRVLLAYHDPMGLDIRQDWSGDWTAYTTQAEALLAPIAAARNVADVRRALHQEFLRWFVPEVAGPEERFESLARNIWDVREDPQKNQRTWTS